MGLSTPRQSLAELMFSQSIERQMSFWCWTISAAVNYVCRLEITPSFWDCFHFHCLLPSLRNKNIYPRQLNKSFMGTDGTSCSRWAVMQIANYEGRDNHNFVHFKAATCTTTGVSIAVVTLFVFKKSSYCIFNNPTTQPKNNREKKPSNCQKSFQHSKSSSNACKDAERRTLC